MKARWVATLLAGAFALLCAPSCSELQSATAPSGSGGSGGSGGSAGIGALIRGATWSLTWDTERVIRPAGGGWTVDTDRGYRVHVTSGWLVDYSVSLGLCDSSGQGGGDAGALGRLFGVRPAYAHEDGNASTMDLQHAEDLTGDLTPHRPWSAAFAAARYCRVHWLAGRGDQRLDAPEGIDLQGQSLVLAGTWERDGASHDLAVSTWWPQGYLVDFVAAGADDGEAKIARITVKRSLGTLFDGIDLATSSDDQVAGLVLENLAAHAESTVELWSLTAP